MAGASWTILSNSQRGALPPWSGRVALPVRWGMMKISPARGPVARLLETIWLPQLARPPEGPKPRGPDHHAERNTEQQSLDPVDRIGPEISGQRHESRPYNRDRQEQHPDSEYQFRIGAFFSEKHSHDHCAVLRFNRLGGSRSIAPAGRRRWLPRPRT